MARIAILVLLALVMTPVMFTVGGLVPAVLLATGTLSAALVIAAQVLRPDAQR